MIRATLPSAVTGLLLGLSLAGFCGAALAQQGEPAMLKRPTELREAPGDSGRSLAALPANEPVTRLGDRQGGWIKVQSRTGVAGWVHMFDVGPAGFGSGAGTSASASGNSVSSSLRGLSNLLTGGSGSPQIATSTIGIRGLEAEDLARAQPNLNAVGRMEQLRQSEGGARAFAAEAALLVAPVPALPAPARGASPQGGHNTGQQQ